MAWYPLSTANDHLPVKPPTGSQLNRAHPLAQGLVGCWLFNDRSGVDSADAGNLAVNGDIVAIPDGLNAFSGSISASCLDLGKPLSLGSQLTFVLDCRLTSLSGGYAHLIGNGNNGGIECGLKYYAAVCHIHMNGASVGASIPNPVNQGRGQIALTVNDTEAKYYRKGVLVATRTGTANTPTSMNFRVAGDGNSRRTFGDYHYCYVYNRPLSASEIASLNANPYQMFVQPPLWMNLGAGGGSTYTADLSLSAVSVLAQGVNATYGASFALACDAASEPGGNSSLLTALALTGSAALNQSAAATLISSLALATTAGQTQGTIAALSAVLGLSTQATQTLTVLSTMSASLPLSAGAAFSGDTGGLVLAALLLETNSGIAPSALRDLFAGVGFAAATSVELDALAQFTAALTVACGTAVTVSTLQTIYAGLSLSTLATIAQLYPDTLATVTKILLSVAAKSPHVAITLSKPETKITVAQKPETTITVI